ncbi:MAG: histidine kinase dimerization/phospho-acceptor domain-containing protein, partial [bacterium]
VKIRTRLTWFGTGVAALTVIIFGVLLTGLVRRTGPVTQDRSLVDLAARTVSALATAPGEAFTGPILPPIPVDIAAGTEQFIALLTVDGSPIFSTGQVAGAPPSVPTELIDQALREGEAVDTVTPIPGTAIRLAIRPFSRPDLEIEGVVLAGQSLDLVNENIEGLQAVLLISGVITVLAAWLVARLVAKRALEPLRQLAVTTDEIASTGDVMRRLPPVSSADEVGALTISFNRMLDRLADSLRRQRQFAGDASHELRNPLSIIRSNISFLERHSEADVLDRDGALADAGKAAVRMGNLLDDLLRLARLDSGQEHPRTAVSIAQVLEEAIPRTGAEVVLQIDTDPGVKANPEDLTRLLTNLIENAVIHGQPPIEVRASADGAEV